MESSPSHSWCAPGRRRPRSGRTAARTPPPPPAPGPWPGRGVRPPGPSRNSGRGGSSGLHGGEDGLGHQHHAGAAPERGVVDGAVHVGGVLAQVVDPHVEQPPGRGPAEQALPGEPRDHVGEDGEDVDAHDGDRSGLVEQVEQPGGHVDHEASGVVAAHDEAQRHQRAACRAPAGRWPGCPARPRRRPGRCRRRSTTGEPISSCTHRSSGSSPRAPRPAARPAQLLGQLAAGDALEVDDPAVLVRTRRGDHQMAVAGDELRPRIEAGGLGGGEGDHDLPAEALGLVDPADLEERAVTGSVEELDARRRRRRGRRRHARRCGSTGRPGRACR